VTPLRTIETDALFVHELEPDVHFVVMKDLAITREVFQKMLEAHISLSGGKKVYVISDHHKAQTMERETMMFAKNHAEQVCHTLILVNRNKIARIISEFFLNVVKPPFKTIMVEDFDAAIDRVKELKNEEQSD